MNSSEQETTGENASGALPVDQTAPTLCAVCGIPLKAGSVAPLCPVCSLRSSLDPGSAVGDFGNEQTMVLREGHGVVAKIIDLGLAKLVDEPNPGTEISVPGSFTGTPAFASPEQFAGVGVDIRSDLYSLGVTLWVMLAGQVPFRGSPAEVMHQHQHTHLPRERLKDVPQPVEVLLEKLLEKDPAQRVQTPNELLKAMPTITGAIDARRRIARQSLQKTPSTAS